MGNCPSCGGLYVTHEALRQALLMHAAHSGAEPTRYMRSPPLSDPVRYRHCPVCGETMTRQNFKDRSGVIVDVCAAHGVWLDRGELEALLRFASSGALAKAERDNAERDAGRDRVDQWARELRSVGPRHYVYVGRHMNVGLSAEDLADLSLVIPGLGPSKT